MATLSLVARILLDITAILLNILSSHTGLTAETFNTIVEAFIPNHLWDYFDSIPEDKNLDFELQNRMFPELCEGMNELLNRRPNIISRRLKLLFRTYTTAYLHSSELSQKAFYKKADVIFAEVIYMFVSRLPMTAFVNEDEWGNTRSNAHHKLISCQTAANE